MTVDKQEEYYLIHSMSLTKKQIKEMYQSDIEEHCEKVTKEEIRNRGFYNPGEESDKS